jgi:hypothetical protein
VFTVRKASAADTRTIALGDLTALRNQVKLLDGSGATGNVVLGAHKAATLTNVVLLSDASGTELVRWERNHPTAIYTLEPQTTESAVPVSLPANNTMCTTFDTTTQHLVAHVRNASGVVSHMTLATTADLAGLSGGTLAGYITPTSLLAYNYATTTITNELDARLDFLDGAGSGGNVVLGKAVVGALTNAVLINDAAGNERMRWLPGHGSVIQSIEATATNAVPTGLSLSAANTMCTTFNSTTNRLVAHVRDAAVVRDLPLATADDLVPLATTASLSDYAKTASLSIYATTASLSTYATTASLSTYATTASLSTYATTASLSDYAKTASLSIYATTASLSTYATTASLSTYATTASLSDYAKTASLSIYATIASLSDYAKTASLSIYATIASLADYATTASLAPYATTASLTNYATTGTVTALTTRVRPVAGVHAHATPPAGTRPWRTPPSGRSTKAPWRGAPLSQSPQIPTGSTNSPTAPGRAPRQPPTPGYGCSSPSSPWGRNWRCSTRRDIQSRW